MTFSRASFGACDAVTVDRDRLIDDARTWLEHERDDAMRRAVQSLLTSAIADSASGAWSSLEDAFGESLLFDDYRLRGPMGPGPSRVNTTTVTLAAAGLADLLRETGGTSVVIGFDGRYDSETFAHVTAQVLSGAGITASVMPRALPTPVLVFAMARLDCAAGVMITGGSERAQVNGLRVYLRESRGSQSAHHALLNARLVALTTTPSHDAITLEHGWTTLGEGIIDAYLDRAISLLEPGGQPGISIAYTPLHGVGGALFTRLMARAEFSPMTVVMEQFEPDPDLATLGSLDPTDDSASAMGLALAAATNCDLLIVHDGDAGRCRIGLPAPGGWRILSNDELGCLLGWWITAGNRRLHRHGVLAQSAGCGSALAQIAESGGLGFVEVDEDFPHLSKIPDVMFAYDTSRGYCADPVAVSDMDGLTAALLAAELTTRLAERGASPLDVLDDLRRANGTHESQ